MDKIILVTQEELKALIYEVLENYYKDKKLEKEQEYSNSLTIDAAVDFHNIFFSIYWSYLVVFFSAHIKSSFFRKTNLFPYLPCGIFLLDVNLYS